MKRIMLLATLAIACTDETETVRTLQSSGFTEIQTTGYRFFGCGDSDTFSTGFRAKNPHGETVEGVVCCGWPKGCTVRF